jgi:membrane protein YqaA with SNARE-associated domain
LLGLDLRSFRDYAKRGRRGVAAWLKERAWNAAALAWGFAEATLFFVVPDLLLSAVGLKRGARAGALASLWAALGAGLGGAVMYVWSVRDSEHARGAVLAVPAISEAMADAARAAIDAHGWFLATLAGPLSTTPFKLYAILAPHMGAPLALFAAASVIARLPRFLLASFGGALLRRWFHNRALPWLAGAWVLFYAVFFALMPN